MRTEDSEIFLLDEKQFEHYEKSIEAMLDEEPELWNKWFTKEGILERIRDKTIQPWVVTEVGGPIRAVFFTQILVGEIGKVLQVFWMKGSLPKGALKCISLALDRFGSHHGCFRLNVNGRRGWERALHELGAEFECITLSRPINSLARN